MTDRTSLSLLKRTIPSCSFPENIVLGDIIQNLFNLRVNYPRRFLHVSILLISDCTLRLLKKLVKRKLQEEVLNELGCGLVGEADGVSENDGV